MPFSKLVESCFYQYVLGYVTVLVAAVNGILGTAQELLLG